MSVPRRMAQAFSLHDEDGMTTVGMVVSLLLALSMIFSSAQVYRIQSVSSRVQSVADAGALAAGNVVAEFMVAVRVCDSVALSLSLTSLTSTGLGVVACCVPGGQGVGAKLLEAGARVADARDSFSKTASEGLTRIQKALPFLAAASAASVAQGNGSNGSDYTALALLVPDSAEDHQDCSDDSYVYPVGGSDSCGGEPLISSGVGEVSHVQNHQDDGHDSQDEGDYSEDPVDVLASAAGHRKDGGDETDDSADKRHKRHVAVGGQLQLGDGNGDIK